MTHRRPGSLRIAAFALLIALVSIALPLKSSLPRHLHDSATAGVYNEEQRRHGEPAVDAWGFLQTPDFWFQSFQNWQSEFLSIGAMVILSIFLREKGSPESKRMETPHHAHDKGS